MSGRRRKSSRTKPAAAKPVAGEAFWYGGVDDLDVPKAIRANQDPSAMVRSLGPPPLPGRETLSEHYFTLLYDKAAATSVALAAASGLLDFDEDA